YSHRRGGAHFAKRGCPGNHCSHPQVSQFIPPAGDRGEAAVATRGAQPVSGLTQPAGFRRWFVDHSYAETQPWPRTTSRFAHAAAAHDGKPSSDKRSDNVDPDVLEMARNQGGSE